MFNNKIALKKTLTVSGFIALMSFNATLLGCATNSSNSATTNDTPTTNKSAGAATAKDNS